MEQMEEENMGWGKKVHAAYQHLRGKASGYVPGKVPR